VRHGGWRLGRSVGDLLDVDRIADDEVRRIAREQCGVEL
jgi:hypothetical protein